MVRTFRTFQWETEEDDENVEKSRTIWWAALEEEGKTFPMLRLEQQLRMVGPWARRRRFEDNDDNDGDHHHHHITNPIHHLR